MEIGGEWYYHNGNAPLGGFSRDGRLIRHMFLRMCLLFAPLEAVENPRLHLEYCDYKGEVLVGDSATGEITGDNVDSLVKSLCRPN